MYYLYNIAYNLHPLSVICKRWYSLLIPIVYQCNRCTPNVIMSFCKLSSVGRDLYKIVCMYTKGLYSLGHFKMVILLVILFTTLSGSQLPPLTEQPYAPMGIKINASKEYARHISGLVILLVYSITTTLLNSRITARKEQNNATRKSSR